MLRMTDMIRNRREPRHETERETTPQARLNREQSRDISRLYTPRIWL